MRVQRCEDVEVFSYGTFPLLPVVLAPAPASARFFMIN